MRYQVETSSGSTYVLDTRAKTVSRNGELPGTYSEMRVGTSRVGHVLTWRESEIPEVGLRMFLLDDDLHYTLTTRVVNVEELGEDIETTIKGGV